MAILLSRLNAKVSGRDVAVKNLVTDLSDGVDIANHLLSTYECYRD